MPPTPPDLPVLKRCAGNESDPQTFYQFYQAEGRRSVVTTSRKTQQENMDTYANRSIKAYLKKVNDERNADLLLRDVESSDESSDSSSSSEDSSDSE